MKKPRKRQIEKARKELERHEGWKEYVRAVGGSIYKDENGKLHGRLIVD